MFAAGLYQRGSAATGATVFMALEGILLAGALVMTYKAYSRDETARDAPEMQGEDAGPGE